MRPLFWGVGASMLLGAIGLDLTEPRWWVGMVGIVLMSMADAPKKGVVA